MIAHHFVNLDACYFRVRSEDVSLLLCIQQEYLRFRHCTETQDWGLADPEETVSKDDLLAGRFTDSLRARVQGWWGMEWSNFIKCSAYCYFLLSHPCFLISNVNSPEVLGQSMLLQTEDWPEGSSCYILRGLHAKLFQSIPMVIRQMGPADLETLTCLQPQSWRTFPSDVLFFPWQKFLKGGFDDHI